MANRTKRLYSKTWGDLNDEFFTKISREVQNVLRELISGIRQLLPTTVCSKVEFRFENSIILIDHSTVMNGAPGRRNFERFV